MSAIFQGHALFYGITPDGTTASMGGYAQIYMDSMPIADRAKFDEHIGTDGVTSAMVWTNPYYEVTANIRPATTTSVAAAEALVVFLKKGSTITLSGFKKVKGPATETPPPADLDIVNGDWLLVGDTTITLNRNDPATVDVVIRRYPKAAMDILKVNVPAT